MSEPFRSANPCAISRRRDRRHTSKAHWTVILMYRTSWTWNSVHSRRNGFLIWLRWVSGTEKWHAAGTIARWLKLSCDYQTKRVLLSLRRRWGPDGKKERFMEEHDGIPYVWTSKRVLIARFQMWDWEEIRMKQRLQKRANEQAEDGFVWCRCYLFMYVCM